MRKEIGEVGKDPFELKLYEETKIEWRINDFSSIAEDSKHFNFYDSPTFSFADASTWYFSLDPNSTNCPEFMALYLMTKVKQKYDMEYQFGFKKSNDEILNFPPGILEANAFSSGACKTIKVSQLQSMKSELIPCNVLTITCALRRKIDQQDQSTILEKTTAFRLIRLERLSENFQHLFDDKDTCDTTLKIKDKDYKVHRAVLVARSPVFAATFKHDTSERQTGVVTIPDCDPDSFGDFLKYLYCGRLEEISFRSALNLYVTSDKYDVPELKDFCVQYLLKCLTTQTICEIALLADKYDEVQLFSAAQEFFSKYYFEIFLTSEWKHLMKENYRMADKLLTGVSKAKLQE